MIKTGLFVETDHIWAGNAASTVWGFNAGPVYYADMNKRQESKNNGLVAVGGQFVYTVLERWYCFCFLSS